jgi:hypothetical protein
MATSPFPNDMPGFYTPPSHAHASSRLGYFEPVSSSVFATGTSSRQVPNSHGHETRRRAFGDSPTTTRSCAANSWGEHSLDDPRFANTKSPPLLAHDRYELANGGTEKSDYSQRQAGDYDDYFGLQKQRGQWSVPPTPAAGMSQQLTVGGMQNTPNGSRAWSIMGLVGGVAGKLIRFCTVPFRGFHAGGGQKYNVDVNGQAAARCGLEHDPDTYPSAGPVQPVMPGDFPVDNYGVLSIESLDNEHSDRPRAKRLRTADNWVMVDSNGETESRPSTPRLSARRLPDHTVSPSQIPRPLSRVGAATPSSKRPSLIPVSRRSTTDRKSLHGSAKTTPSSHVRQRSYSRLSYGSPAMFDDKTKKPNSPLPKESQRLINKVRREEMEEDARMRRMSFQMSALLREAQEALGTKIEVEDSYDDEGSEAMQQSGYFPRFS